MTYIWAWAAPGWPPEREISSSTAQASLSPRPAPPYLSGIRQAEKTGLRQFRDEFGGIAAIGVEFAPVLLAVAIADGFDGLADFGGDGMDFACWRCSRGPGRS